MAKRQIIEVPSWTIYDAASDLMWSKEEDDLRKSYMADVFDFLEAAFAEQPPEDRFTIVFKERHFTKFIGKWRMATTSVHPLVNNSMSRVVNRGDKVHCQFWRENEDQRVTVLNLNINQLVVLSGTVQAVSKNRVSVANPDSKIELRLACKIAVIADGKCHKRNRSFIIDTKNRKILDLKKKEVEIENADMVFEALGNA